MIIWINGAFGSGKTQTSFELHRKIPNSFVYDPEEAGYFISKNIPKEASRDDFQQYPMWRDFNYAMLTHIYNEYKGTIVVPMTVVNPIYFNEIVGRLRADGVTVNHFTLLASKDKILHRLRTRGDGPISWAAQQIDRCLEGLSNEVFKQHLHTDDMPIEAVVERISYTLKIPGSFNRYDISGVRLDE